MLTHIRPAVVTLGLMTLLTGVAYPLAVTGIALALPGPAQGSLVRDGAGRVVGSALIGQGFRQGRIPAWPAVGGGERLRSDGVRRLQLRPARPQARRPRGQGREGAGRRSALGSALPADAVTASASGLDPEVSPAFAALQAPRIAAARHATVAAVQAVIDGQTRGRTLLILGEPRVNVLAVNRALDAQPPVARR